MEILELYFNAYLNINENEIYFTIERVFCMRQVKKYRNDPDFCINCQNIPGTSTFSLYENLLFSYLLHYISKLS